MKNPSVDALLRMILVAAFGVACMFGAAMAADLHLRRAVPKKHADITPAPKYESYFQGLPNKLNPKEPPVERPAGLP